MKDHERKEFLRCVEDDLDRPLDNYETRIASDAFADGLGIEEAVSLILQEEEEGRMDSLASARYEFLAY